MPPSAILQTLIDSKKEYTNHLCDLITPSLVKEFFGIYDECRAGPNPRNILQRFQSDISKIAEWNTEQIHQAFKKFTTKTQCGYLSNLVKELVLTNVKIHLKNHDIPLSNFKVQIRVPGGESFYHRVLVNSARSIWKQPYIFYHQVRTVERQSNLIAIEKLIKDNIISTLRACIPMEEMMQLTAAVAAEPPPAPPRRRRYRREEPTPSASASSSESDEESGSASSSADSESDEESGSASSSNDESGSENDEESGSASSSNDESSDSASESENEEESGSADEESDSENEEELGSADEESGSDNEEDSAGAEEAPPDSDEDKKVVTIEQPAPLSQRKRPIADGTFF